MALRGNLKDFSLPDVFQLVQLSGKTGVLRVVRPGAEGSIWFRDGEVFFAQSNWRHELLGDRLVNAQRITPAALERALQIHKAEGGRRRLGEILVSEGYITQHVLETFVQEQIEDTIFDIMRWDEGDFDFEVLPEVVHEDIGLSVSVENIVMEGSRRLEEWNRIKKKVPSPEMVFKMATAPGEGTFEISLKPVEWNLLLLIDGTRSVRELAEEVWSTDFEVARVIYGLFSAGLLEVPSDEEVERLRAERAAREEKRVRTAARVEREAARAPESGPVAEALLPEAPEPEMRTPEEAAAGEQPEEGAAEESQRAVPEMPEFLSVGAQPPSDDDMAVFTEMMEAVLSPHDAAAETPAEQPPAVEDEWDESDLLTDIPAPPVVEMEPLEFTRTGDFETDLRTLGLGEYPPELLQPEPVQSVSEEEEVSEEEPVPAQEDVAETATPGGEPDQDLDSLLESLGGSADESQGVITSGTDFGGGQSADGYISTDSFLAEFDTGGGLSGGLGDELTALTGGGTARTRPVTTVNAIPELGEGGRLHLDQAVDKELLKKIIQGIEDL